MAATLNRSVSELVGPFEPLEPFEPHEPFEPLEPSAPRLCIGLLGLGRIGRAVADAAPALGIECRSALVREPRKHLTSSLTLETDGLRVIDSGIDVLVEVLGGTEPARSLVIGALDRGIPVVTANKSLMAAHGPELREVAARAGVPLLYEAAVLAGVPFVGALAGRPVMASATRIDGILNGTSHFITSAIERGATFGEALADANARGFAEPDSRADTSSRDAAEKLTILLHLCGAGHVTAADICRRGIETLTPADFAAARRLGGSIKPVACASLEPGRCGSWAGPAFIAAGHPFAHFSGVTNALELRSATGEPILFAGPGAGPAVTAATILDDVHTCSNGSNGSAGSWGSWGSVRSTGSVRGAVVRGARFDVSAARFDQPPASRWFLRIVTEQISDAHLAEFLAARNVAAARIERGADDIAVLTVPASWAVAQSAARTLEQLGAFVTALPVVGREVPR